MLTNRALGMTFMVVLVLAALAQAQTFTSIFSFDSPDGGYPETGRLAIDRTTGTLYGTTSWGGSSRYDGVVFSITTTGVETTRYNFTGGSDGGGPSAPVIRDSQGNVYGTTGGGGCCGYGTVFKIDSAGNETVLHSFSGGTSDGCSPWQGLVRDKEGDLYGTTAQCGASNFGTIFKIDTAGNFILLHSFAGWPSDGRYPYFGSMRIDKKGNLYGVTIGGGSSDEGTLYEYNSSGKFSLLHSFVLGPSHGCYPYGTPARDYKGNVYGTTNGCGTSGHGTVWKVSSSGKETILHSFTPSLSDGADPYGGVALDAKGNLYGLAENGGAYGGGVLYEVSSSGRFKILHSFDGSDGAYPYDDEVLTGVNGTLYGVTLEGGTYGVGTVWKYVP